MIRCCNGFFGDQKGEFTITKASFPENTLIYVNNGTMSSVKGGDHAIYLDCTKLGQLICAKNLPEDFKNYECKQDEVKTFVSNYNVKTSDFLGVQNWLGTMNMRPFCHKVLKKRNLKFCIRHLNSCCLIHFKVLLLKNVIQCY